MHFTVTIMLYPIPKHIQLHSLSNNFTQKLAPLHVLNFVPVYIKKVQSIAHSGYTLPKQCNAYLFNSVLNNLAMLKRILIILSLLTIICKLSSICPRSKTVNYCENMITKICAVGTAVGKACL